MKYFTWDPDKNAQLKRKRGISFERILLHIEGGDILDILEHPHPERYPGQKIFIVRVEDYVYVVPFEEDERQVMLRTVFPSRKLTKRYLGEEQADE